jgi:hypothetical protein
MKGSATWDRRQHPHVIAGGAFDAAPAAGSAAIDVPSSRHHHHLHAHLPHFGNLPGHFADRLGGDADAVLATQSLAAELEENPPVFRVRAFLHTPM